MGRQSLLRKVTTNSSCSRSTNAFSDEILAAGSYNPSHAHAEVLDIKTGNWTVVADYPFKGDGNRISS